MMEKVVHKTKLLIVDVSPSMAQVLKTFAWHNDYDCDVFSDPAQACQALKERFVNINESYDCVMLGWPAGKLGMISDLLGSLATPDHSDLPLIVLSEEESNDIQTLTRRRGNTQALLWKDHKQASDIIDSLVFHDEPVTAPTATAKGAAANLVNQNQISASKGHAAQHVLLVDSASPVSYALRDSLTENGYRVSMVGTAAEARAAIKTVVYDLVLTEFYLRAESGEDLCKYLQDKDAASRPVYAVLTNKNLDTVVRKSLAVGAITCLDKTEKPEILFARVDAIAKGITRKSIDKTAAPIAASAVGHASAPVLESVQPGTTKAPVINKQSPIEEKPEVRKAAVLLDARAMERAIGKALSAKPEKGVSYSVLMLDIKLEAKATGDRLSIGASAPMLEMVKARLATLYTRERSLAYMGDGKFVLILATNQVRQALLIAKKLVEVIPSMINYLSDVELVTHGSFYQMSGQTETTPRYVLKHCSAACIRTDIDKADNSIYVIDKDQYLLAIKAKPAVEIEPAVTSEKVQPSKPVAKKPVVKVTTRMAEAVA